MRLQIFYFGSNKNMGFAHTSCLQSQQIIMKKAYVWILTYYVPSLVHKERLFNAVHEHLWSASMNCTERLLPDFSLASWKVMSPPLTIPFRIPELSCRWAWWQISCHWRKYFWSHSRESQSLESACKKKRKGVWFFIILWCTGNVTDVSMLKIQNRRKLIACW